MIRLWQLALCLGLFALSVPASADTRNGSTSAPSAKTNAEKLSDAIRAGRPGPLTVPIANQGTMSIPAGLVWSEGPAALAFITTGCKPPTPNLTGLVLAPGMDPDHDWVIGVGFIPIGHVADTNWQKIDPDLIFKTVKASSQNPQPVSEECRAHQEETIDWAEPPHYDPAAHRLSWIANMRSVDRSERDQGRLDIVLGRYGFLMFATGYNLEYRDVALRAEAALVDSFSFDKGHTYKDFDPWKDRTSPRTIDQLFQQNTTTNTTILSIQSPIFLIYFFVLVIIGVFSTKYLPAISRNQSGKFLNKIYITENPKLQSGPVQKKLDRRFRTLFNWILYPFIMILNIFGFLIIYSGWKAGGFSIISSYFLLSSIFYTVKLTQARIKYAKRD